MVRTLESVVHGTLADEAQSRGGELVTLLLGFEQESFYLRTTWAGAEPGELQRLDDGPELPWWPPMPASWLSEYEEDEDSALDDWADEWTDAKHMFGVLVAAVVVRRVADGPRVSISERLQFGIFDDVEDSRDVYQDRVPLTRALPKRDDVDELLSSWCDSSSTVSALREMSTHPLADKRFAALAGQVLSD